MVAALQCSQYIVGINGPVFAGRIKHPAGGLRPSVLRTPILPADLRPACTIRAGLRAVVVYVVAWWLVSRVTLAAIGALSALLPGVSGHGCADCPSAMPARAWTGCDTIFYLDIARHGYSLTPLQGSAGVANIGFFPLYPLVTRACAWVARSEVAAGLIVSNLCLLVGAVFLYRLAHLDEGEDGARRTVGMLFLFPTAFMLSAIQTEGLFFCLVVLCFYAARREKWWPAGGFGLLAALTRPTGVLLVLPLSWMYFRNGRRHSPWAVLSLLLPPAGTCLFGAYTYHLCGGFFAYTNAQSKGFGHHLTDPLVTLYQGLASNIPGMWLNAWALDITLLALLILSGRLRTEYTLFAVCVLLAAPLTGTVAGSVRYLSPLFPLFILLSRVGRSPTAHAVLAIVVALLQGCLVVLRAAGSYALC